jgi:asparagine synthase (glutamine-hydrolysing)
MCGISGGISLDRKETSEIVRSIMLSQDHRGPDYSKKIDISNTSPYISLAHNRLIINDLSSDSNQPLWDVSKRYCLVFNGEIYNYIELRAELKALGCKFSTQGDSEVLMQAIIFWGTEGLNKLNGMFAFCLYDSVDSTFILARDRFAKKPLYYYYDKENFFFASTAAQIARDFHLPPDFRYLAKGLQYWIYEDNSEITQYKGLNSLEGGCFINLKFRAEHLKFNKYRYYDLKSSVLSRQRELYDLSPVKLNILISETLESAVDLRLRSDVPVGVSLSGGLDSSTIAYFAHARDKKIQGITFGDKNQKSSEGPLVERFCSNIGMSVSYIWPTFDEILDAFEKSIFAQDSPVINPSYVAEFLVYKRAKELGLTVMLSGQGGDEVFLGYRKYFLFWFNHLLYRHKYVQAFELAKNMITIGRAEIFQIGRYISGLKRYNSKHGIQSVIELPVEMIELDVNHDYKEEIVARQIVDLLETSIPTQVKSEDRNSMYNSIETRAPFLDYRLVEYGLALPTHLKIKYGYGKWIIRDIMKGKIPDEIRLARYKRGYDISQDWIAMGLGKYMRDQLHAHQEKLTPFLKRNVNLDLFTDKYFKANKNAFQEASTLLWLSKRI